MKTSQETKDLFNAIVDAQAEMPTVNKSATNPHFQSKYAPLDEVVNAAKSILAKHGLAVIQGGEETEGDRVRITTRIIHRTGQWIESCLDMVPRQNDPQGVGACLTYGSRYGYRMVGVVTDEDDDGNTTMKKETTRGNQNPKADPPLCPKCGRMGFPDKKVPGQFYCWAKKDGCGNQWTPRAKNQQEADLPLKPYDELEAIFSQAKDVNTLSGYKDTYEQDIDGLTEDEREQLRIVYKAKVNEINQVF